jgi:hypothetical protein
MIESAEYDNTRKTREEFVINRHPSGSYHEGNRTLNTFVLGAITKTIYSAEQDECAKLQPKSGP